MSLLCPKPSPVYLRVKPMSLQSFDNPPPKHTHHCHSDLIFEPLLIHPASFCPHAKDLGCPLGTVKKPDFNKCSLKIKLAFICDSCHPAASYLKVLERCSSEPSRGGGVLWQKRAETCNKKLVISKSLSL